MIRTLLEEFTNYMCSLFRMASKRTFTKGDGEASSPQKFRKLPLSKVLMSRTVDYRKPTEVDDGFWVWVIQPGGDTSSIIGKWLVFKDLEKLDDTWTQIRTAIIEQKLASCVEAKSSTVMYNPSSGPGPKTNGVICVYTKENDVDDIGYKLIDIVQQNITYKLDAVTRAGAYAHQGVKVSTKTLYWNEGKPSFQNMGTRNFRRSGIEDKWQINIVNAPEPLRSMTATGKWIVYLPTGVMTQYWHQLKRYVESRDSNFGVIKMECPKASKKNPACFLFFTTREKKEEVGKNLATFFDYKMEYKDILVQGQESAGTSSKNPIVVLD